MSAVSCWNCRKPTGGALLCEGCGKVQPPVPGTTHFELLGVPRSVDVDGGPLERAFRERAMALHPDRFAQADARERRHSLEQTTALNEAYRVLRDPTRRALYVLSLHGMDLTRDEPGASKALPMEFLEDILQRREALDAARAARDWPRAQALAAEVRTEEQRALDAARAALTRVESASGGDQALREATQALARVRYFHRFLEEVEAMDEELHT